MSGSCKPFRNLFRFLVIAILISSYTGMISSDSGSVNGMEEVDPISIESNGEMSSHSRLKSGSGTAGDPFIFSDMEIDCSSSGDPGLHIANTTYHVVFRNITIEASDSSPAIYLRSYYSGSYYAAQHITLDNVTVTGGGTHIYMYVPNRVSVKNCNFSNPYGSGKLIHTYYGYYLTFENNTFNAQYMVIDLEETSSINIRENRGDFRYLYQDNFRYSGISNNTFRMRGLYLYSGWSSMINGNNMTGTHPSYDIIRLYDCNRISISNNSFFKGNDAIFVYHPNYYDPVYNAYYSTASITIEYNLFNDTSAKGIYFYYRDGHAAVRYMQVHHNTFMGCGDFAVDIYGGGSTTSKVFRNVFMYNHGSGTDYNGNLAQCRDGWSQFSWSKDGVGNYWHDWDNTDSDSDGFSDTLDYKLYSNNGQVDPDPVSNKFFDFGKPQIVLVRPASRFSDNRYINFSWDASDDETGISMVQIKKGISPWTNITGRDHHGLYLHEGTSNIKFRAVDIAGLKNTTSINVQVQSPNKPVIVDSPVSGYYYSSSEIDVSWTKIGGFVPRKLHISNDGENWTQRDPNSNFSIVLPDGHQELLMEFTDHYDNVIRMEIPFTIDTEAPKLDILYPKPGSVISNGLVEFIWDVDDTFPAQEAHVSIDGEGPKTVEGDQHSIFLEKGSHSFEVSVQDLAGNERTKSMFFTISDNTSLHIISPRFSRPTPYLEHTLEWEYLTELELARVELLKDGETPIEIDLDSTSFEIDLEEQGLHDITVRAYDPAGNVFSDTVHVTVDTTPPEVGFIGLNDGDILNRSEIALRWSALEEWGIEGYDIFLDGSEIFASITDLERVISMDPGQHTLKVRATDLAGNTDQEEITITVDVQPPELEIISPSDVVTEPYIELRWRAHDNLGILRYNYSLDGGRPIGTGSANHTEIQVNEGQHSVSVFCKDLAGNSRVVSMNFLADLHSPEVELSGPGSEHICQWSGLITWNITESIGITSVIVDIDGAEISLSTDARNHFKELEDGRHTISVTVTDMGGWQDTDSISFMLDSMAPEVEMSPESVMVSGREARLLWNLSEDADDLTMRVMLDGEEVNTDLGPDEGSILFRELNLGMHHVNITFTDRAGNNRTLEYQFEIANEEGGQSDGGGSALPLLIVILLFVIIIAAVSAFMVMRKRRKVGEKDEGEPPKNEAPRRPDRISIGPIPARSDNYPGKRETPKPRAMPAPSEPVKKREDDGSYIRPKKEKPKNTQKKVIRNTEPAGKDVKRDPGPDIEEWGEVEDWSDTEELEEFQEMEEL